MNKYSVHESLGDTLSLSLSLVKFEWLNIKSALTIGKISVREACL